MEPNNAPSQTPNPAEQPNDPINPAYQPSQPAPQTVQPQVPAPPSPQPEAPAGFSAAGSAAPTPQPPIMPWDKPNQPAPQAQQFSPGGLPGQPSPAPVFGANQQSFGQPKKSKRKALTIFVGVLAGLLLLGGSIAAAYFGVVVPNKPENILKQSLLKSLEENSGTTKGIVEFSEENAASGKIAYELLSDVDKKAFEGKFNVTVSGIDIPLEARYVDGNVYFKIGDLKTLSSLVGGYAAMFGTDQAQVDQLLAIVSDKVANQWVVVDSTLLDTAGLSCFENIDFKMTDADKQLLKDQYEKNQFATIKNHQDDSVNGAKAIKYELEIDGKKLDKYMNSLNNLSLVKALEKCAKDSGQELDTEVDSAEEALPDKIPVTVWVDKDKKVITKTAYDLTEPASGDSGAVTVKAEGTTTYQPVSITAPKDAKPLMQLVGELQQDLYRIFPELSSGFSSFGTPDDSSSSLEFDADNSYMIQ